MRLFNRSMLMSLVLPILLIACNGQPNGEPKPVEYPDKNPFPSTYKIKPHKPFIIRGAVVLTGSGVQMNNVDVLVVDGKIADIGAKLSGADEAQIIDANNMWLTPGLIDVHSHMGVYPAPGTQNHADGNEMTDPVTAQVWAEHSVWPQDPQYEKALAGGITTYQVLPGSGNLIGGRGVTFKSVPAVTVQGMKFPGAPYSLKMACGENPKRVYGEKGRAPSTRMGNMAGFRQAWISAQQYSEKWQQYAEKMAAGEDADQPDRDLSLETLKGVLDGEILIHNHCYRADEMAQMIDMSKEFGYSIAAFHHAVEAYKVAPLLAKENICAVMWADWWGFKQEAFDMVRENIALVDYAKACAVIHSDSGTQIQRLNQEIAKAMTAGNRMGLNISSAQAIRWLTLNPAKSLGLEDRIGSIEVGKNADLVLWDREPTSIYAHATKVWIDGTEYYDRNNPANNHTSDFNLGLISPEEDRP